MCSCVSRESDIVVGELLDESTCCSHVGRHDTLPVLTRTLPAIVWSLVCSMHGLLTLMCACYYCVMGGLVHIYKYVLVMMLCTQSLERLAWIIIFGILSVDT